MNIESQNYDNVKCPEHDKEGAFIPSPEVDIERRKLIVTFICPLGHSFVKEFDLQ